MALAPLGRAAPHHPPEQQQPRAARLSLAESAIPSKGEYSEFSRPSVASQPPVPQHPSDIFRTATPAEWSMAHAESFHSMQPPPRQESRDPRYTMGYDGATMLQEPSHFGSMAGSVTGAGFLSHVPSVAGAGSVGLELGDLPQ